jgi:hypothetical protein
LTFRVRGSRMTGSIGRLLHEEGFNVGRACGGHCGGRR